MKPTIRMQCLVIAKQVKDNIDLFCPAYLKVMLGSYVDILEDPHPILENEVLTLIIPEKLLTKYKTINIGDDIITEAWINKSKVNNQYTLTATTLHKNLAYN